MAEVPEFGVTGDGELDLGLDCLAAGPAAPSPLAEWSYADLVDRGWEPGDYGDPATDPDDDAEWLAGLPPDVRAEYLAGPFTGEGGPIPAGFLYHESGGPSGIGFASGGVLDMAEPDGWLAGMLETVTADGYDGLGESELIGVLCGWRRLASWAAAGEAPVTALVLASAHGHDVRPSTPKTDQRLEAGSAERELRSGSAYSDPSGTSETGGPR